MFMMHKEISENHPIRNGGYRVWTPVIERMEREVNRWISNRSTGGLIYGRQQFGKTEAIRYLKAKTKEKYGDNAPVFEILMSGNKTMSESFFYSQFLYGLSRELQIKGNLFDKKQRIINYIFCLVENIKKNRVIFFIDEAQNISEANYDNLMLIQNELDKEEIISTFILVGQPELVSTKTAYEKVEQMQIVVRYMSEVHEFHGLQNVNELVRCLKAYDELTEYPIGSGCSYSRFFAPKAFDAGWRLAKEAAIIWQAFEDIRKKSGLELIDEIPMRYLARTVEYLLKNHTKNEYQFEGYTYKECKIAVVASGYAKGKNYFRHPSKM